MRRITTDELWLLLRYAGSEFFSVEFERRTKGRRFGDNSQAGTIKKMNCRTGMQRYKRGIQSDNTRDQRDFQHCILTVWSVDAYRENMRRGMSKEQAAFQAWRSVDIATIRSCSLLERYAFDDVETDLPPDIVDGVHQITNQFRLANLPR